MTKLVDYTSETTNFINEFLNEHPKTPINQKELRSTWWNKDDTEVAEERKLRQTNLKVNGYTYF